MLASFRVFQFSDTRYPQTHAATLLNVSTRWSGIGAIAPENSNSRDVCLECHSSLRLFFANSSLGPYLTNSSNLILALYWLSNAYSRGGSLRRCARESVFG